MKKPEYYKEIANYYDRDACHFDERYWANPVLNQMRQSFREETKRYQAVNMLEIGFGTGLDLVHFAKTHPERQLYGIDLSPEMFRIAKLKIEENKLTNVTIANGSTEDIPLYFPKVKFDLIYVYFGALNSVDLESAANDLIKTLNTNGVIVLTYVNRWYVMGMLIECMRLRFSRAFARLNPVWRGYSSVYYLSSQCYSAARVEKAFSPLTFTKKRGYSILLPAWFYTKINQKIRKIIPLLWKTDNQLNKTPLWQLGEYGLVVFKN